MKFDAWILPVLNVYFLGGYASTTANVNAEFSVEHDILQRPPAEFNIESKTNVKGPYTGIGSSVVAGYGSWFMLADANYGKSWPDELENSVDFMFVSLRSGFMGKLDAHKSLKAWIGGAYMYSRSTLKIKAYSDVLNEVLVSIQQQPVNPWTVHSGLMLSIGKNFEIMAESGTNFNDASVSVVTASWRF
ncbi:MAG TPA: hypothetical protein VLQ91_08140 [Draconibacterium sp.]|nr:hypothetical protein [Draconibacterium sp.]